MTMSEFCLFVILCMPLIFLLGVLATQAVPVATVATKRTVEKRRARNLKVRANVRASFPPEEELRALARSVIKQLIHPLIILRDGTILDGECRWRGLMLENPDFEVDVIVVDREMSPAEITELQLVSALHSTTLTSYDQAVAIRDWLTANPGKTAKELAEKIDRDSSMVSRFTSLWKTTPAVIKAASEGKIGVKAWHQLSLLPESEMNGVLEMYLSNMPVAQIAEITRKKRTQPLAEAIRLSRFKYPLPSGVEITVAGKELSLSDLIDALSDLVKEAKKGADQGLDIRTLAAVAKDKAKKGA